MKGLLVGALVFMSTLSCAYADIMIDVRNDTSEDCSLAINARTDKTKWVTQGWYVFASGEEAPIILKGINDIHNVYIYNDCKKSEIDPKIEVKKAWVKTNYKFMDETPREKEQGYEEVVFERLSSDKYQIQN
ncbi:MAG: DUF1036 domain-containing protein [Aeromonadales bacterium]|nr:DUF1036 domain-containing protein [Aeromonadales bacterium]